MSDRPDTSQQREPHRRSLTGLLGPMRIRKKLILLHTGFSLTMAVALLLAVRPAGSEIVRLSTDSAARAAIEIALGDSADPNPGVRALRGDAATLGITDAEADRLRAGEILELPGPDGSARVGAWDASRGEFITATALLRDARWVVSRIYMLLIVALLAIYFAVAFALEVFVLPRHVYAPIQRLRRADRAVQEGHREMELIPESEIPSDELGEIMRTRNESITRLRNQERALTDALERLEAVASDLKQKNELIENAQRNLADHDRLASLGVMSAGLAHEMNTPLSVLKGAVEAINEKPGEPVPDWQAALMHRVISRLERLSDGLLDFARVRPPNTAPVEIRAVIDEAWTLVHLDRNAGGVEFLASVEPGTIVPGDADRLTQVFVNLLRNSVDAMEGAGRITADAGRLDQEGQRWLSIRITNDGPRIDPEILPRLFEPFESTRLDDRGTGLGLAIAEGIIREHGGFIVARNLPERGCTFEITLPLDTATGTPERFPVSIGNDGASADEPPEDRR